MNEQQYKAAQGELSRLEALRKSNPDHPEVTEEYIDTLRREIEAFETGARSKGRPNS